MDECMDYGTDTTLFSNSDYTDEEAINTRDVTDSREMQKLEDKNENCGHYISGCKIVAKCCNKEFGCRICHDSEISEHTINRYEIEDIICNNCRLRQPVSNSCINKECSLFGGKFASYYCDICHLYSDNPVSEIYHCEKCNICRMCGIGNKPSDFFHCDKCGGCINKELENTHKCVTDALRNDCCICLDNIFLSRETVVVLPCGHAIHGTCFNSSIKQNKYTCPLCRKIMIKGDALDMMIRQYDDIISLYPYDENIKAEISCNDCAFKGEVAFHPIGLKCGGCGGYNTTKIR
jgi:RING finger/CHY zinc finger protein 1